MPPIATNAVASIGSHHAASGHGRSTGKRLGTEHDQRADWLSRFATHGAATLVGLLLTLAATAGRADEPLTIDWKLEATAAWQPRDSQAEFVHDGRLWIGGGWFDSFSAPPRDVWSSADGRSWDLVTKEAPWLHSDLPMNLTFNGRMWMLGGWYNGRLPGHSATNEVWSSTDGKSWDRVAEAADWTPRLAGAAVAFQNRIWVLGGTENYYFGDENSLKNDVWSSPDGKNWDLATAAAPWSPRAYHQGVVLGDRIYVMGGGNYVPEHHAKNDVWSSADGVQWRQETAAAPWSPRLWFSAAVYRDRIWVLGGWSEATGNVGDVWHSDNGKDWQRLESKSIWKARHEHSVFVFQDKLWIAGGHAQPLSSEVWSLSLPQDWQPSTTPD
ncbi:MAG: galactose oxidase [Planctomycetaceae bacterium]|nr:MAG: galactose oxidase [Planctomycetaceae bacterium]